MGCSEDGWRSWRRLRNAVSWFRSASSGTSSRRSSAHVHSERGTLAPRGERVEGIPNDPTHPLPLAPGRDWGRTRGIAAPKFALGASDASVVFDLGGCSVLVLDVIGAAGEPYTGLLSLRIVPGGRKRAPEPMIHLRQPPYRLPFFESGTYGIDLGSPFAAESGEPMRIRVELVGGRCTHLELRVP